MAVALVIVGALVWVSPEHTLDTADRPGIPTGAGAGGTVTRREAPRGATEIYETMPFLPPQPGYGTVTCDVQMHFDRLVLGTIRLSGDAIETAFLIGGQVVAQVPAGSGSGELDFSDIGRGRMSWEGLAAGGADACVRGGFETFRTGMFGRVEGTPLPASYVRGCGGSATIADGSYFMDVDAPAECEVEVVSVIDERFAEGNAVPVRTEVGRDAEVLLQYPLESDYRPFTEEQKARGKAIDELLDRRAAERQ